MKPILFNTEMVKAIIAGNKTKTRRIIKPQPTNPRWNNIGWLGWDDGHGYRMNPPCEPGDILWVRETWCDPITITAEEMKWKPSIHMPKEAARIFLHVKNVYVERLQSIDGMDVLAEGVDNGRSNPAMGNRWENMQRMAFARLWNSTIKNDAIELHGWQANPWVWVIEFERCNRDGTNLRNGG